MRSVNVSIPYLFCHFLVPLAYKATPSCFPFQKEKHEGGFIISYPETTLTPNKVGRPTSCHTVRKCYLTIHLMPFSHGLTTIRSTVGTSKETLVQSPPDPSTSSGISDHRPG